MGKAIVIGSDATGLVTPATAEAAAEGYFHDRIFAGAYAPKPPIERWRPDQRERFEAELARLEEQRVRQMAEAAEFVNRT